MGLLESRVHLEEGGQLETQDLMEQKALRDQAVLEVETDR